LTTNSYRVHRVSAIAVLALAFALFAVLIVSRASLAGATSLPTTTAFYLDIGGSASIGVQPDATGVHNQRTDHGYSNDLVGIEALKGVTLQLTEIGCSGETTTTMLAGGDKCYDAPDSQLAEAIAFLSSHRDQTGLVTIDLGFNDIKGCLHALSIDSTCVSEKLDLLQQQLPEILSDLRAAAGPDTTFVGVGHYNPYLADESKGLRGRLFADRSASMMRSLNTTLEDIYNDDGIQMADVAKQFNDYSDDSTSASGLGRDSSVVARTCALTWMCPRDGMKANIHPDDAGYLEIAEAVDAVLPATL
jgi:lysophospholipase L1-like esterase